MIDPTSINTIPPLAFSTALKLFTLKDRDLASVDQRIVNAIQRINHYTVDTAVCFCLRLSGGQRFLPIERNGPKTYLK